MSTYKYQSALPKWKKGTYTEDDAERCFSQFNRECMLIKIRNNKISYEEHEGFQDRHACVLELLDRVRQLHTLPDIKFCLFTGDVRRGNEPKDNCVFTFARHRWQRNPLFPNFNFIHHKSCGIGDFYLEVFPELMEESKRNPWEDRIDKCFFIGSNTNSLREKMYKKTGNDEHFDIRLIDWDSKDLNPVSLKDHCKFKYLLNINGWGYSGRLHFLIATGAKVFQLESKRPWRQFREFWIEPSKMKTVSYSGIKFKDCSSVVIPTESDLVEYVDKLIRVF